MEQDKELPLEFGSTTEVTVTLRVDPKEKKLAEELKFVYGVKNIPDLHRKAFYEVIHQVAKQVKGKAS